MAIRSTRFRILAKALPAVAGLICLGNAQVAAAQTEPSQSETLFQSGLDKMRQSEFASACPDLKASYTLEPLPGVLFTLAECEAGWGKLATALEHYHLFIRTLSSLAPARRQKFDERRRLALEQIASLTPTLPLVSIDVTEGAPPNLVVKRDNIIVAASTYGVESPVDPGELLVTAETGGKVRWQRRVRVAAQDRAKIVIPWPLALAPGEKSSNELPPRATTAPSPLVSQGGATVGSSLGAWKYITAGIGAAGLTTSLVAGAIALKSKASAKDECVEYRCSPSGLASANSAKSAAKISTVGFIVGLAGAAGFTGLVLFGEPKHRQATTGNLRVTIDGTANTGDLRLEGSF